MKIEKTPILPERIRKIDGSFSWLPHTFLTKGFLASLTQNELLVYILLVLVSDRSGLSYYSQDKLGILLKMSVDDFIDARNGLISKDLIAFDGLLFQVLSLPLHPAGNTSRPLQSARDFIHKDRLTIRRILDEAFKSDTSENGGK